MAAERHGQSLVLLGSWLSLDQAPSQSSGKRCILLCPFYGGLPSYFSLFADSCRNVPSVDFWILTDGVPPSGGLPPNLKIVPSTLNQFEERATTALGLPVEIAFGYKLCDFKPMYGEIFGDLIQAYDYWGYCDLDQLFVPSFESFLLKALAKEPELLNIHNQFAHGPITIYRNDTKLSGLFRKSKHWRNVACCSSSYQGFDECGQKFAGIRQLLGAPEGFSYIETSFLELTVDQLLDLDSFECLTTVMLREYLKGELDLVCAPVAKEGLRWQEEIWFDGNSLIDSEGRSWHIYHWVTEKERRKFSYPGWSRLPDRFYVTQYGFFDCAQSRMNFMRKYLGFVRALGSLLMDRGQHAARLLACTLGLGPRPPDFR